MSTVGLLELNIIFAKKKRSIVVDKCFVVSYMLQNWICMFEKPKTEPNSLEPSTTVLSPHLKFGCLSARLFYHKLNDVYSGKVCIFIYNRTQY